MELGLEHNTIHLTTAAVRNLLHIRSALNAILFKGQVYREEVMQGGRQLQNSYSYVPQNRIRESRSSLCVNLALFPKSKSVCRVWEKPRLKVNRTNRWEDLF